MELIERVARGMCRADPEVRGYNSDRVFDGVRQLDGDAASRHRARMVKALAKLDGRGKSR